MRIGMRIRHLLATILFVLAGIVISMFISFVHKEKPNIEICNLNAYTLLEPLNTELIKIIVSRHPGFHYDFIGMGFGEAFRKLKEEGKATSNEVEVADEFEKTIRNLSILIKKISTLN